MHLFVVSYANYNRYCFSSFLEKNLRLLMDSVDDLSQETNKFFNYQRSLAKQQQAKQQYLQKRVNDQFGFFVYIYYTHSSYQTSIFGKNRAYYIHIL